MTDTRTVPRKEFLAVLSLLEKRATWLDRWRAKRVPEHWLNDARRELLLAEHGLVYSCHHGVTPEPCEMCFGKGYSPDAARGGC